MAADELTLWQCYKRTRDPAVREELLKKNLPLVRFTLERMAVPRRRSWIDLDDLITAGIIGLMDAVEKFDPVLGGKFSTYAFFRIRGAVLDELRATDWVPRSVRQKTRELERAHETLERRLHRPVTDRDLARQLGLSLGRFRALVNEINVPPMVSLDELLEDRHQERRDLWAAETQGTARPAGSAFSELAAKETREILAQLIERLPERERWVLTLYYYEELTMREIAAILEVTESRVCQIHAQAVGRLCASLQVRRQEFVRN